MSKFFLLSVIVILVLTACGPQKPPRWKMYLIEVAPNE